MGTLYTRAAHRVTQSPVVQAMRILATAWGWVPGFQGSWVPGFPGPRVPRSQGSNVPAPPPLMVERGSAWPALRVIESRDEQVVCRESPYKSSLIHFPWQKTALSITKYMYVQIMVANTASMLGYEHQPPNWRLSKLDASI